MLKKAIGLYSDQAQLDNMPSRCHMQMWINVMAMDNYACNSFNITSGDQLMQELIPPGP